MVVQGAGMLGLYACALLRHKGYERVLCCDNIQGRLAMVERFGGEPCQDLAMEPSGKLNRLSKKFLLTIIVIAFSYN